MILLFILQYAVSKLLSPVSSSRWPLLDLLKVSAAEGYVSWMDGKLDGCKWALSLNGAVFLFMKDWSSHAVEEMNEICMERPYRTGSRARRADD